MEIRPNTVLDILQDGPNHTIYVCPWQEITLLPAKHWQIDLILTEAELMEYNPAAMGNELVTMWYGLSNGYKLAYPHLKRHMALNPQPLYKYWTLVSRDIDKVFAQSAKLSGGWEKRIVTLGIDHAVATRERNDGRWDVSAAMFGKPK